MLKLEIVLDKEKIKAEGQYDWAAMQAALDNANELKAAANGQ